MLNKLINGHTGFAWGVRATAFLNLGLLAIANSVMTTRLPSAKQRGPGPKLDMKAILTDWPYLVFLLGCVAFRMLEFVSIMRARVRIDYASFYGECFSHVRSVSIGLSVATHVWQTSTSNYG